MSDVAILTVFAATAILVLASVIGALLRTVRHLTNAIIANDAHELRMLEAVPPKPALNIPFVRNKPAPYPDEDDDDLVPLGLGG